jgi:hypothetical protein
VLEIQEATEGVSVCLSLHHGESLLVVRALSVNRATLDMHLLIFAAFHVLLILHMLEMLEVLIILLFILLFWLLSWTGALSLHSTSTIDIVRLDLEVFLLSVLWCLGHLGGGASKDAVFPSGSSLVRSDVLLGIKWIDPSCIILKSMFVVLLVVLLLTIIKLTLRWSWAFLGSATLDEVVIVTKSWLSVSTSVAGGNARVARKIEQLLAEWRNVFSMLIQSSSFTFLNALVKNAIHVIAWFGSATIPHVAWCLNVCAHFNMVWTNVGC